VQSVLHDGSYSPNEYHHNTSKRRSSSRANRTQALILTPEMKKTLPARHS